MLLLFSPHPVQFTDNRRKNMPVSEEAPLQPATSPYGNTKQICEEILEIAISYNGKLNVIALRYFNRMGAHPSALIGEYQECLRIFCLLLRRQLPV